MHVEKYVETVCYYFFVKNSYTQHFYISQLPSQPLWTAIKGLYSTFTSITYVSISLPIQSVNATDAFLLVNSQNRQEVVLQIANGHLLLDAQNPAHLHVILDH